MNGNQTQDQLKTICTPTADAPSIGQTSTFASFDWHAANAILDIEHTACALEQNVIQNLVDLSDTQPPADGLVMIRKQAEPRWEKLTPEKIQAAFVEVTKSSGHILTELDKFQNNPNNKDKLTVVIVASHVGFEQVKSIELFRQQTKQTRPTFFVYIAVGVDTPQANIAQTYQTTMARIHTAHPDKPLAFFCIHNRFDTVQFKFNLRSGLCAAAHSKHTTIEFVHCDASPCMQYVSTSHLPQGADGTTTLTGSCFKNILYMYEQLVSTYTGTSHESKRDWLRFIPSMAGTGGAGAQ
jgi:hypothetical protein